MLCVRSIGKGEYSVSDNNGGSSLGIFHHDAQTGEIKYVRPHRISPGFFGPKDYLFKGIVVDGHGVFRESIKLFLNVFSFDQVIHGLVEKHGPHYGFNNIFIDGDEYIQYRKRTFKTNPYTLEQCEAKRAIHGKASIADLAEIADVLSHSNPEFRGRWILAKFLNIEQDFLFWESID